MSSLIQKLVRPNVRKLAGYVSARHLTQRAEIFLDANETAFDAKIATSGLLKNLNRYPDPLADSLRQKLATAVGIHQNQILVGNGSDELIWLTLFAFAAVRENILVSEPTFSMYEVFAKLAGVNVKKVPLEKDFSFDSSKILKAINGKTKIIFLCSPNNPTGRAIPRADIEKIVKLSKKIVVVDEAYIEFVPRKSVASLVKRYPNLIVLRTFSKAWGLAGARIGYALASREIIEILAKIRAPYSVDSISARLAERTLGQRKKMETNVAKILCERDRVAQQLGEFSCEIFPSDANFLLVKFSRKKSAHKIFEKLSKNFGIVVRDFSSKKYLKNCLRITIGTPAENIQLLFALKKLLK